MQNVDTCVHSHAQVLCSSRRDIERCEPSAEIEVSAPEDRRGAEACASAAAHDAGSGNERRLCTHVERILPGRWRPWALIVSFLSALAGAAAGILGGLFGAGAPPALVLFAYFASRKDLELGPSVLRSTGQTNYFGNIFIRALFLAARGLLFFDRWWKYFCVCILAGGVGAIAGTAFYRIRTPDPINYQRMMQALLLACGVFFLATPQ